MKMNGSKQRLSGRRSRGEEGGKRTGERGSI